MTPNRDMSTVLLREGVAAVAFGPVMPKGRGQESPTPFGLEGPERDNEHSLNRAPAPGLGAPARPLLSLLPEGPTCFFPPEGSM